MFMGSRAAVPAGLGAKRSGVPQRSGARKGRIVAEAEARAHAEAKGIKCRQPQKKNPDTKAGILYFFIVAV